MIRIATTVVLLLAATGAFADDAPKGGPEELKHLKYRSIGPAAGGRVSRAVGVPGDPLTYYAATASGGVWKSVDGGVQWKPVTDEQPVFSFGAVAVAPSDPNVVYAGSGEANIRGNVAAGNGIYKSTDAGKTWKRVWNQEGQIATMTVHPSNPEIAFAAVVGHAFGPNPERGVYRTKDGGATWEKMLGKDSDTGASDVALDPSNPRIVFAALWQARRSPWSLTSGGTEGGVFLSRDGGDTWNKLTKGLPEGATGKIAVRVAPSDPRRIYALIEATEGGLYRSDDGGESWKRINKSRYLQIRPWYFTHLTIDPEDADTVWSPSLRMLKSVDGGVTFKQVKGIHHGDHHDLWIDPENPKRMIAANDGGVDITVNGGETWYAPMLPISQFYHVSADNRTPYHVSGNMQDLGTASGPSNSLSRGGITRYDWNSVGGGETGNTAPDPRDPDIVYAGEYFGYISRYDDRTRQARNMSIYPMDTSGQGAEEFRYRFQWTAPIVFSRHEPNLIYHGANVLLLTRDGGMSWKVTSPDLTRDDKSKQKFSGGPITGDNTGVEVYGTIFSVAESTLSKDVIWAGSDDGLVHLSIDGAAEWRNVTPKEMPEWGTVSSIEASHHDPGAAYVVVDRHRLDDMKPYLFKTTDHGSSWTNLGKNLPQDIHLKVVREDPKVKGLLYVGTEHGVSFSKDGGLSWQPLKLNLPAVPVHDLVVKDGDLVVGTHGRSIWILDDLTPLRELSPDVVNRKAHLFPTRPAKRYRYHRSPGDIYGGENPSEGALIHYYLKEKPEGEIELRILDAAGTTIRTLSSKAEETVPEDDPDESPRKPTVLGKEPGVNRVAWDLRHQGATKIPQAKIDMGDPSVGPLAVPGEYRLELKVGDETLSAPLVIEPDPRVDVSLAELVEQRDFALKVRDAITRLSGDVMQLRAIRDQLNRRNELLKDESRAADLVAAAKEIVARCDALEERLHNPKAEVAYDILAMPGGAKLYSKLGPLLDWVNEGDGAPTQGMREVFAELQAELTAVETEQKALVSSDLARLEEMARSLDLPHVIVREPGR
jgi:photosystem II stability/assembly factor-like uncharacterized protein